ncbi:fasciclin domain-containing protein [Halomonas stenophila]|uniref:Putative surface protein with fasciclin (FAS1) repeats n=1 Tax=Halomonas stenophila TaxID=795312 RepID=A0A7W5HJQ9_9GAMM|nr:fasciclin domain-containing protein [Halomonas stenophila]MBB3229284.1 putative surface protein with fasciclin (FAS1) repeats [Halomonas stenophila]
MKAITTHAPQWIGTGMLGLMLAGSVQADSHGMAKDIVDTAVEAGQFETLVAAVEAADLVDTLEGEGPFTVFAPTDEAFAALPEGTVEDLLKPENRESLRSILTYHVVAGTVMAEDAMAADSATTVQGQDLTITTLDGQVMVDDATVIQADIEASNGVIHVIDGVLMPE